MRLGALLLTGIYLAGCASKPISARNDFQPTDANRYEEATSAALVFDPPVAAGDPLLELSREERQPSAFVSFEGPTTSYFWIHTDDLQDSNWGGNGWGSGIQDRYQRRAVIEKTGVTYR